ncbi:hypothetical protein P3T76_016267 [Phytophthora citrophthora]|uniref:Peptidase S54 rhomboid domain-containing protein n=1 Tax=Phytophthora citrophthora TaxID=4793 RepID=A0AAD9FXX5_9STRA|nr:hypothetical protein P3T76_016267 [Phytophthora citrophthora]
MCPCLSVLAFLTLAIHCCTWLRGLGAVSAHLGFWVSGFLGFWPDTSSMSVVGNLCWGHRLIENTLYVRAAANRAPPPPCLSVLAFLTLAIHCCTWLRGLGAVSAHLGFWVSGFLGFWPDTSSMSVVGNLCWGHRLIENTLYVRAAANRAPPPGA